MPQLLRRKAAPIDWSPTAVANHPILSSGVGACITAFASLEAALGAYLVLIRWKHPDELVQQWKEQRSTRQKTKLVRSEADRIPHEYARRETVEILDAYVSLSKRRAKLAHGFFGIITDREDQFAWRQGGSAAEKAAAGLTASLGDDLHQPKTWLYRPKDFEAIATECAHVYARIGTMYNVIPIAYGLSDFLSSKTEDS